GCAGGAHREQQGSLQGRRGGAARGGEGLEEERGILKRTQMPSSKEIRAKIKSVQNTRKITKAMEMVAASKMRKAQDRMRHARPYGDKIRTIASHLAHANTEYRHPFLVKREGVKAVALIVVTSDKV